MARMRWAIIGWLALCGVPVARGAGAFAPAQQRQEPLLHAEALNGLFVRDVAAQSDFIEPPGVVRRKPDGSVVREGTDDRLALRLSATYRKFGDAIRIDGTVRDLSERDRAITAYFTYPVDAVGWLWHDDQRTARVIRPGEKYGNFAPVGAGANGLASRYPLACISGEKEALAIAAPLDVPRLYRFGYDADSRELYAAIDLGLAPDTKRFPSQASFSLVLYRCDPKWGFRSALERYYRLFPPCFTKRNRKEGIWMPFTDIATVQGFEDFGFQFKEGNDNVAFDEEHGIYSFVYVEPMSLWVPMPKEMERTNERALAYVRELSDAGKPDARAALTSVIEGPQGEWAGGGIVKAPWCDGAVYHMNPNPGVVAGPGGITQFEYKWGLIEQAFRSAGPRLAAWRNWAKGYALAAGEGRNGSTAAKVERGPNDESAGASQAVTLDQREARPLAARVWTKAEGATGESDGNYSLYIDAEYADGTPGYALIVIPAEPGTHGWQLLERTVTPPKPVRALTYHVLFRKPHTGAAWFDDAFLGEEGSERNLLKEGGFEPGAAREPILDGTYLDSFEMGSKILNYRREHFAHTETPLVFDSQGRVCQMEIFHTVEFAREVARRMWAKGKMTFANNTPVDFPWGAAWLDIMGTETDWAADGAYAPNSDALMNYRRALCHQRPYLLLLNTDYNRFKPEWVESYMKRCAAYGIFPSMFSHNGANDPYWQQPRLYNRDRLLFRRYIPVIQALSAAGWEPVTYARSDNPKVYVERFGRPGGPLYLTVFNDSPQMRRARITVEATLLRGARQIEAREVLSGTRLALTRTRAGATLRLDVAPEDVKVIRLAGE
jgi:hypothetical protein